MAFQYRTFYVRATVGVKYALTRCMYVWCQVDCGLGRLDAKFNSLCSSAD